MVLTLTSSAFEHGASIPRLYTCEGRNVSPPLSWSGAPSNTKSLVLIVDDPDAPDPEAPQMVWVHWAIYNLPTTISGFGEAVQDLPTGAIVGLNDWHRTAYGGPCPSTGRHRYLHKLYALDRVLAKLDMPTKAAVETSMEGNILDQAQRAGTKEKSG